MRSDKLAAGSPQLEILGKLAPAIAHDINNLLSGILGYSQVIISDPSAGGLKSCAEEIEKAGKRISGLVRFLQIFNQRQLNFQTAKTLKLAFFIDINSYAF